MPEPKSKTAMWVAIATALSALGTTGAHRAISPAQAATPSNLATAEQVAKLEAKVDRFIDRVQAVELKQAEQQGAQNATHRTR